jgi:hypothetical protein
MSTTKQKYTEKTRLELIKSLSDADDQVQVSTTSDKPKQKKTQSKKTSSENSARLDLVSMLAGEPIENIKKSELKTVSSEQHYPNLNPPIQAMDEKTENTASQKNIPDSLVPLVLDIVPLEKVDEFISSVKEASLIRKRATASKQESARSDSEPVVNNLNLPKKNTNDVFLIHWNGRFGNRMHTYAFLKNRAAKLGGKIFLPSNWEGDKIFNLKDDYEIIQDDNLRASINQTHADFDNLTYRMKSVRAFEARSEYRIKYISPDNPKENYKRYNHAVAVDSVSAYHKSIFQHMKLSDVLSWFEFNDEVKNLDIYKMLEDKQGTYDIAHLRRDDISSLNYNKNGGYSTISKDAYMEAFKKYDYDPDKIEWTSDDWSGKWGVGNSMENGLISKRSTWRYPEGTSYQEGVIFDWLPDFLRLYFARSIFRANSSFSFWACTLAKGREVPPKIFSPRLDKRVLYKETQSETMFNFEEGNHPHWLCITGKDKCDDIIFSDESKPKKS